MVRELEKEGEKTPIERGGKTGGTTKERELKGGKRKKTRTSSISKGGGNRNHKSRIWMGSVPVRCKVRGASDRWKQKELVDKRLLFGGRRKILVSIEVGKREA